MVKKVVYNRVDGFREFTGTLYTDFPMETQRRKKVGSLRKLEESSVTLIGAGFIGSYIIPSLIQAGVGKMRIIDHETVKREDVKLGCYFREDVGKSRCEVLQDRFQLYEGAIKLEWYPAELMGMSSEEILGDSELVVLCSDTVSPTLHNHVNEICLKYNKNWLSTRIKGGHGELGPAVIPYQTACYKCYELRLNSCLEVEVVPNELMEVPESYRRLNMAMRIIGGYASLEIEKMLTEADRPVTADGLLSIDFGGYTNTLHPVLRVPNCPVCSRTQT